MTEQTKPHHSTFYQYCSDIEAMHTFYITGLGLEETFYDAARGWLTCDSGQLNLVFVQVDDAPPIESRWAKQPTFADGTAHIASWVITIAGDDFDTTLERLKAIDFDTHMTAIMQSDDATRSVWVRDPMGTTIELYTAG